MRVVERPLAVRLQFAGDLGSSIWRRCKGSHMASVRHCVAMVTNLSSQIASQNIVFGCKSQLFPMQALGPTA
jgi:hypothetical protein